MLSIKANVHIRTIQNQRMKRNHYQTTKVSPWFYTVKSVGVFPRCVPLLDEFHCFSVHREWRFGLLGALLQSIATFNERHDSIQVVHCLLKTVQLSQKNMKIKSVLSKFLPQTIKTTVICT